MLFNSLDKFKRKMVMLIVLLMFAGLMMFVVPVSYVPLLGKALGFIFLVLSILQVLEFISSNKALIHYIRLFVGLLAGMAGVLLFSADGLFLTLLNWLVGTLPILLGGYGLYHALMYARRSGRSGWWVLVILSCLLLLFGFPFCESMGRRPPQSVICHRRNTFLLCGGICNKPVLDLAISA